MMSTRSRSSIAIRFKVEHCDEATPLPPNDNSTHVKGFSLRLVESMCPSMSFFVHLNKYSRLIFDGDELQDRGFTKVLAAYIAGVGGLGDKSGVELVAYRLRVPEDQRAVPGSRIHEEDGHMVNFASWNEAYEINYCLHGEGGIEDLRMGKLSTEEFNAYSGTKIIDRVVKIITLTSTPRDSSNEVIDSATGDVYMPVSDGLGDRYFEMAKKAFVHSGCKCTISLGGGPGVLKEYENLQDLGVAWTVFPAVRLKPPMADGRCGCPLTTEVSVPTALGATLVIRPHDRTGCQVFDNCSLVNEFNSDPTKNDNWRNLTFLL